MTAKIPDPVDLHVGTRVRMRRLQLGVSQESLGAGLGLTFQQVQKYEKGTNRIGASRLAAIGKILSVAPGFFFESALGSEAAAESAALPASFVDRFLASRDGVMIAQGFARIADPQLRGAIARLVRDAGRASEPPETE